MDRFSIRDGEDVAPEFCRAEELGDFEAGTEVKIDVAAGQDPQIVATVTDVLVTSEAVHVKAGEFAFPFVIPVGEHVYFAVDEDDA